WYHPFPPRSKKSAVNPPNTPIFPYPSQSLNISPAALTTPPAAPASPAPPPRAVPVPAAVALPLHDHHLLLVSSVHECQHAREEEEEAVHNRQRPACLEHRTCLAERDAIAAKCHTPQQRKASRGVDSPDEGTDEREINESDEAGVVFGTVVGEEGANGPDDGENDDDEEDEDGVGCEGVGFDVEVDEPREHAYYWDLGG
ncbi:hypothetical protein V491_06832, partial [Pseudogymnoascus sp. VKM F-3775]